MPFRIYFDLSSQDEWHRIEWERLLDSLTARDGISVASERSGADCEIITRGPQFSDEGWRQLLPLTASDISTLVWDYGDFPTGRYSGFYCSLGVGLFDSARHRTISYPITFNELVQDTSKTQATYQFSFVGGITSKVRTEIFRLDGNGLLKLQPGDWSSMFDRSGQSWKHQYANSLARSKFVLCPRGNGLGSVRLFETMKARRVPVIISDNYVLPQDIDWDECSVRVAEREVHQIPGRLESFESKWEIMADNARRAWEEKFSERSLIRTIGVSAKQIIANLPTSRSRVRHFRSIVYATGRWKFGAFVRKIK